MNLVIYKQTYKHKRIYIQGNWLRILGEVPEDYEENVKELSILLKLIFNIIKYMRLCSNPLTNPIITFKNHFHHGNYLLKSNKKL